MWQNKLNMVSVMTTVQCDQLCIQAAQSANAATISKINHNLKNNRKSTFCTNCYAADFPTDNYELIS